ncbi:MAG: CesT family type III secretion system chaperone [Gemmatimonadota bacterium]|nr:CesT family type III secretion system chaperone [Gemmatimonadota bacterium]
MVTREDLESFLIQMDLEYDEVDEGMFLVQGRDSGLPVVVHHADELLLIRMKVMDLPEAMEGEVDFYRALLELNATDVVHGAYGLEDGELILSDTLELETLDFHELRASTESIELAATSHMERIRALAGVADDGATADRGAVEAEG